MSALRGLVYAPLPRAEAPTRAWLIISADDWNESLQRYVGVPLWNARPAEMPFVPQIVVEGVVLDAVVGRLTTLFPEQLAGAQAALSPGDMAVVEAALRDILVFPVLFSPRLVRPRPPAGPITYPLWGEMYYVGPRIGGEFKRFVCVSVNEWNVANNSALFVRTTSQRKRSTVWFPYIQSGQAQAACGDIAFAPGSAVNLRHRPPAPLVSLTDMLAVARGIAAVLGL